MFSAKFALVFGVARVSRCGCDGSIAWYLLANEALSGMLPWTCSCNASWFVCVWCCARTSVLSVCAKLAETPSLDMQGLVVLAA
jgi:hypothetical protein